MQLSIVAGLIIIVFVLWKLAGVIKVLSALPCGQS